MAGVQVRRPWGAARAWPCSRSFTRLPALVPLANSPPPTSFGGRGRCDGGGKLGQWGGERPAAEAGLRELAIRGSEPAGLMVAAARPQKAPSPTPPGRGCSTPHTGQLAAGLMALLRVTPGSIWAAQVFSKPLQMCVHSRACVCVGGAGRAMGVEGDRSQGLLEGSRPWMSALDLSTPRPATSEVPHFLSKTGVGPLSSFWHP